MGIRTNALKRLFGAVWTGTVGVLLVLLAVLLGVFVAIVDIIIKLVIGRDMHSLLQEPIAGTINWFCDQVSYVLLGYGDFEAFPNALTE